MSRRGAVAVAVAGAAIASGCSTDSGISVTTDPVESGTSESSGTAGSEPTTPSSEPDSAGEQSIGDAALAAARFGQPGLLLDRAAAGSTLDRIGHLLVGPLDLSGSYVEGSEWCQSRAASCVGVAGDDDLMFGGSPLDDFVLVAESEVSGDADLAVADVEVLHHPVTDQLRLSFDVRSVEQGWSSSFDQPRLTIGDDEHDIFLDGPDSVRPGVVTRYEVEGDDLTIDGPVELVIPFSDGVQDGRTAEVTVRVDGTGPPIERKETAIDANPPVELYRSSDEIEGDADGTRALPDLIDAIVDGDDPADLVVDGSAAATTVATIVDAGDVATLRVDPDDESAVCWQLFGRGTFCERWRDPVIDDGLVSSWSIEGVDLADLVDVRAGSLPGAESQFLRLPLGRVVFGSISVRNAATSPLYVTLYSPTIFAGAMATSALRADGAYVVEPDTTESATMVIGVDDFNFDVVFEDGLDLDGESLVFPADAPEPSADDAAEERTAAAIRLASLIGESRFAEAIDEVVPDTDAALYLSTFEAASAESSIFTLPVRDNGTAAAVCVNSRDAEACAELTVDELDRDGRISSLSVDGTDVAELLVVDRSDETDGFVTSVDAAIYWPGLVTMVSWSVANGTESDVLIENAAMLNPDGVMTPAVRPSLFEELPAGRTVGSISSFPGERLDETLELRGSGDDDVRSIAVVVPLGDTVPGIESTIELEATSTELETRGGTTVTLPGSWNQYVLFDEEAGVLAGTGTQFGPPKAVRRSDVVLMAFSPEQSPFDLSADELAAGLETLLVVTEVENFPAMTPDGRPTVLLSGAAEFLDESSVFFAVPAQNDVFVLVFPIDGPEDVPNVGDTLAALSEQAGVTEN